MISKLIKIRRLLESLVLPPGKTLISEFDSLRSVLAASNNAELQIQSEQDYLFLRLSDLSRLLISSKEVNWEIETRHPIAIESMDHIFPRGVKTDETRSPSFANAIEDYFGKKVSYLDLGCAGGGVVYDFIVNGNLALGIEGSDYALIHQRTYWREIQWALKTADLTKPLSIKLNNQIAKFDVIGAWEFFEHIKESDIPQVLLNVRSHLRDEKSMLLANIAMFDDCDSETHWHQTVMDFDWWKEKFENAGFEIFEYPIKQNLNPRGTGNTLGTWGRDYNITLNPEMGFVISARLKNF